MSILIKGMEMPKNCDKCGFQSASRFCNAMPYNFCERTDDIGRSDWCPLIEVPSHGRLIDADELVRIWKGAKFHGNIEPIVNARPTVIEAEGSETDA